MHGAHTELTLLQRVLGVSAEDLQRALARLLDEHLIRRIDDNTIGGLHRLRSRAITEAAHRIPPPLVNETARLTLRTAATADLASVTSALMDGGQIDERDALCALEERLVGTPQPTTLVACLDGLHETSVARQARRWAAVLDEHGVPAAQREAAALSAAINSEPLEAFDERIRAALPAMTSTRAPDPRAAWLAELPEELLRSVLGQIDEPVPATSFLAAFHDLGPQAPLEVLERLTSTASDTSIDQLASLVGSARGVDSVLADRFVEAAGGFDELQTRAEAEVPWVTSVTYTDAPERVVNVTWLFVGDEAQGKPHDSVVDICRLFAGLFPRADIVAGKAVDPSGQMAGFGDIALADKRIARRNLPTAIDVRWNRTLIRTFAQLSKVAKKTERLASEAELVRRTATLAWELAERWIRGQRPLSTHVDGLTSIVDECLTIPAFKTIDHGSTADVDTEPNSPQVGDAAAACRVLCGNALPRLFQDPKMAFAAFLHDTVHPAFRTLGDADYWHFLEVKPIIDEIESLAELALHLHAAIHARLTSGDSPSSRMRRAARRAGRRAVSGVAEVARDEARDLLHRRLRQATSTLDGLALPNETRRRLSADPSAVVWPPDEVAIIVEVPSLFLWLQRLEEVVDAIAPIFDAARGLVLMPRREGKIVLPYAMQGRRMSNGVVVPANDRAHGWGLPEAELPSHTRFVQLMNAAVVVAALDDLAQRRSLLPVEQAVAQNETEKFEAAADDLITAAHDDTTDFLAEILTPLAELFDGPDVAGTLTRAERGEDPELRGTLLVQRTALAEWDLNASSAQELTDRFLTSM